MSAWYGLVRKEYRLSRAGVLLGLVLLFTLFIVLYYLKFRVDPLEGGGFLIAAPMGMIIGGHLFYLTFYMLFSLSTEAKQLHLWLHNPQPSWMLLSAKLINGIAAMVVSLSISILLFYILIRDFVPIAQIQLGNISLGIPIYFGASLYIAMWFLFLWTIYQVLKTRIGKWANLVLAGLILIPTVGMGNFKNTHLYALLTRWGELPIFTSEEMALGMPHIYLGWFVFYLLIIIVLFLISCWFIDKKVEV